MEISTSLVANRQAPEAIEPGQRALGHPAIAPQAGRTLLAFAGNARLDAALPQGLPTVRIIVALVRVNLRWALAGATTGLLDWFHRVYHRREDGIIRPIGAGDPDRQGNALAVHHEMPFRAGFAAIGGVRARRRAPLLAGTLALSTLARAQSMRSAAPNWSNRTRCKRCQTPAAVQSCKRRQQVTPLPQPSSWGSSSHGMPLMSTKRIPVNAARSGTRGRPPRGLGGSGGNSGAIAAHNSSDTSGFAMVRLLPLGGGQSRLVPRF